MIEDFECLSDTLSESEADIARDSLEEIGIPVIIEHNAINQSLMVKNVGSTSSGSNIVRLLVPAASVSLASKQLGLKVRY